MSKIKSPGMGTEVKLNISIVPSVLQYTMDQFDFSIDFYGDNGMLNIPKAQCIRVDESNYVAIVDTSVTGSGSLDARVTAFIPDEDCDDGLRTEVVLVKGIETIY